ncbi:MAG: regulatory protein RecX [marine bacterium B5-7]|nr:MAG: regulatory protein RecX [marine bacterium B5-7]
MSHSPIESHPTDVRRAAMNHLSRREHTRLELYRKLTTRGFPAGLVGPIIEDLANEGLQSDTRFAGAYTRYRRARGYGPVRISQEMRERGLSDDLIGVHIDIDDEDWLRIAAEVLAKKAASANNADPNQRAKLQRFLQYRGFTSAQIRAAMRNETT